MTHLVCVTRAELTQTNQLLSEACAARGVEFIPVEAGRVRQSTLGKASGARLLYCAAVDPASDLLEQMLAGPRVTGFHDPIFRCVHVPLRLQQAGLPVPAQILLPAETPEALTAQISHLGGYPVVLKRSGLEGGAGVSRIDTRAALDAALANAEFGSLLQDFVPHRRCFRLTVLGGKILACTAYAPADGDFRTNAAGAQALGTVPMPEGAAEIARRALAALALDFGGVDLMETNDGMLLLSEVNFPCYFAEQQIQTGCDIAGRMVDYLLAKSRNQEAD